LPIAATYRLPTVIVSLEPSTEQVPPSGHPSPIPKRARIYTNSPVPSSEAYTIDVNRVVLFHIDEDAYRPAANEDNKP